MRKHEFSKFLCCNLRHSVQVYHEMPFLYYSRPRDNWTFMYNGEKHPFFPKAFFLKKNPDEISCHTYPQIHSVCKRGEKKKDLPTYLFVLTAWERKSHKNISCGISEFLCIWLCPGTNSALAFTYLHLLRNINSIEMLKNTIKWRKSHFQQNILYWNLKISFQSNCAPPLGFHGIFFVGEK